MIPSRIAVSAFVALSSLMVSVDPGVTAAGHARAPARPERPMITAPRDPAAPPAREALSISAEGPAPADLEVEVTRDRGGHRVAVRRPGYLVALQYGAARAAGKDWAAVHVEVAPGGSKLRASAAPAKAAEALSSLVWEATPLSALTTERGLVALRLDGADLRAEASRAAAPEPAGTASGPHHTCAAHRDPRGGFTVLCRLHHGVRRVSVANVTGPRALDHAWVIPGKDPLIRLDLPLAEGLAEARLVGFVHGITGAVLRAEASWAPGEPPALVIEETERSQPLASDIDWR
jgi:hypothetical protein